MDAAAIVIIRKNSSKQEEGSFSESVVWSDTLEIPSECEKGPNGEWSILKDPHIVFTNGKRSRVEFLRDALSKWRSEVEKQ